MKNKLIQQLQILMKQQGVSAYKEAFYSGYGVSSSKDMSEAQLRDAIKSLGGKPTFGREKANANTRWLRSEVLKLLTSPSPKGLNIPNEWLVLNPFIERHGGKKLTAMSEDELGAFKKKLYAMRATGWSYKQEVEKPKPVVMLVDMSSIGSNSGQYNA